MRCGPGTGGGKPKYECSREEKRILTFFFVVVEVTERRDDCGTHSFIRQNAADAVSRG